MLHSYTCETRLNYQDFFSAWEDLLSFLVPGGTEKIAGLLFARGVSTQTDTMIKYWLNILSLCYYIKL